MNKMLRLVAWAEILAGVFMLMDVAGTLFSSGASSDEPLGRAIFIGLGTLSLFAGIGLLRSSKLAWLGSVALQIFLMPAFFFSTTHFRPGLGFFIPLGIEMPAAGGASPLYEFSLGVDYIVSLAALPGQQYLAVNLAALACLIVLLSRRPAAPGVPTRPPSRP